MFTTDLSIFNSAKFYWKIFQLQFFITSKTNSLFVLINFYKIAFNSIFINFWNVNELLVPSVTHCRTKYPFIFEISFFLKINKEIKKEMRYWEDHLCISSIFWSRQIYIGRRLKKYWIFRLLGKRSRYRTCFRRKKRNSVIKYRRYQSEISEVSEVQT